MTKQPARFICIGTHHKTGTLWMRKAFRAISEDQGIPFMQMYKVKRMADLPEKGPQIVVNWHSSFPQPLLDHPNARFMHVIRDPRDVLLSGMRYHQVTRIGNEKHLRQKRADLGRRNYQQYMNALPNDQERLLFEMREVHALTVAEMRAWNYRAPNVAEFRYEDLIADTNCTAFRKMLEKFQIEGLDIDRAVQSFWENSLFGGYADPKAREGKMVAHVSDAAGKTAQWREMLPREVAEVYVKEFGNDLKALKYEKNNYWVKDCLPAKDCMPAEDMAFAAE